MTTPARSHRLLPRAAVGAGLAALLAGCGAGLQPQTYRERVMGDATNATIGQLAIRNAAVAAPAGGLYLQGADAAVNLVVVNQGSQPDQLQSASADLAPTVSIAASSPAALTFAPGSASTLHLTLRSVSRPIRSGEYVTLTLAFARNGQGTIQLPVAITGGPGTGGSPAAVPTPTETGGATPTPGATPGG